ncbi:MAG: hypothetical protein KKG76_02135 [Euryarchaeota archaeon]|nr:hypothetical protein [Euryarchaeota archaeon]
MKLSNNENGVSEVVGAMFILLIIVVFLGGIQAYEVPKWNKELEKQAFDVVYQDFLDLGSDFEYSSLNNLPITSILHTGVRYPERFSLRNPGQGAYGSITTYPVKINISYNSNGTIINENYTSLGIIYELKGLSNFPKLVYEHGIVINDFGNWNYSDEVNNLITDNGIFIPFLNGVEAINSAEVETYNIFPVTQYFFTEGISTMNVTIETKYPELWANMLPVSSLPGSQYTVDNREIRITNISGFNLRNLSLPVTSSLSPNNIYSGTIRFTDTNTVIYAISNNITNDIVNNFTDYNSYVIDNSSCSFPGRYIWDIYQGCVNLPKSTSINKFIVQDIKMAGSQSNADFIFMVRDYKNNQFEVTISFNSSSNGDPTSMNVTQTKPLFGGCSPPLAGGQVNLTSCYIAANIDYPNVLKITHFDTNQILFAKFVIS